jgi:hypothetical protein
VTSCAPREPQWKVIDANALRHPTHLIDFFTAHPKNTAVITDFCCMECYKGDPLVAIRRSVAILAQYSDQVVVLKGTQDIAVLTGQRLTNRTDLVDWDQSSGFALFCAAVDRARTGEKELVSQIKSHGAVANDYLEQLRSQASSLATSIRKIGDELPPQTVKRLRSKTPLTVDDIRGVMTGVTVLARTIFESHPEFAGEALESNPSSSFVFRFSLACYLLTVSWIASGGVESAPPARLANDVVDMNYVATATYFDGIVSDDRKLNEICAACCLFLEHAFVDDVAS